MKKSKGMTSKQAQRVKLAGHKAEKIFADLIGGMVYTGLTRKKDVLDKQGNIHSVKSGAKKWQMFLYSKNRFETSIGFFGANFFIACIDSFPKKREEYVRNKERFKSRLQEPMRKLKNFLSEACNNRFFLHDNKIIFLLEAIFHSSEVDYLTINKGAVFHIFDAEEVIKIIHVSTTLVNSKTRQQGQMDNQKVVFKIVDDNSTIGEIEMRNDSDVHYRQVKFWMDKEKTFNLLKSKISPVKKISERISTYGRATRRFKL